MNDPEMLFMPVRKVPVEEIQSGEFDQPSGLSHAIIVTKPDGTDRIVKYASDIYHLVPNKDIIKPLEDQLSRFFEIERTFKVSGHARFFIDYIMKGKGLNIGKNDKVFPRIRLSNSYDGSLKYQFSTGFWRLICENGLMVPESMTHGIKMIHTPSLGKETSFEAVLAMASEFTANSMEFSEIYLELQDQSVRDYRERIEEVTEATKFPVTIMEEVVERMETELISLDAKPNDWLLYNAFNYQLNHNDDSKMKENKRTELDTKVLDYLLKY